MALVLGMVTTAAAGVLLGVLATVCWSRWRGPRRRSDQAALLGAVRLIRSDVRELGQLYTRPSQPGHDDLQQPRARITSLVS
ncbi:MAG: hypothetical protein ACR2N4_10010 [Jatrophihabitans sp.]